MCGWSYRPEKVLVADEEPHNISGLLCMSFLCPLSQSAGDGFMEEEVRSHDGCYGPQVHPIPLLPGNHLTEELKEGLRGTQMETNIQMSDIKGIKSSLELFFFFNHIRCKTEIKHSSLFKI